MKQGLSEQEWTKQSAQLVLESYRTSWIMNMGGAILVGILAVLDFFIGASKIIATILFLVCLGLVWATLRVRKTYQEFKALYGLED